MTNFQDIIKNLKAFWAKQGCAVLESYDVEVGAGTLSPFTLFEILQKKEWNVCYAQHSRRPTDGRYGENPNRLCGYFQFQVILKPVPQNPQDLLIKSLEQFGISKTTHDIRFVEDDWENPSVGASGVGFEVWIDGMECIQWTYMKQIGGIELDIIPLEITYGLERIGMYIQDVDSIFDITWSDDGKKYCDVARSKECEVQMSRYYQELANSEMYFSHFDDYKKEVLFLVEENCLYPAYELCLKMSHTLNILDARGSLSQSKRMDMILTVRNCVRDIALKLIKK